MSSRQRRRLSPDVLRVSILLFLFGGVLAVALATDAFDEGTPETVHRWVRSSGVWAPAVYIVGFVVRPLTLVPLMIWLVVGGIAFGWGWGALYAVIGVNLGAAAEFMTARFVGRDFVERFVIRRFGSPRGLPRGWSTRLVLSLQLLPVMPHDLLNAAAACSQLPYWRFLIGSALGTLPGLLLYTYAGSVLMAPGSGRFYAAFVALAALSVTSLWASRRLRSRRRRAHPREGGAAGEEAAPPGVTAPAGFRKP